MASGIFSWFGELSGRELFDISRIRGLSFPAFTKYLRHIEGNIPSVSECNLNIYDFPNLATKGQNVSDFITELSPASEPTGFHIIVTNSAITKTKPVSLPNNVQVIIVNPGIEEDDAVCICLAASYVRVYKTTTGLKLYSEDDYNTVQHNYKVYGRVSLVSVYNSLELSSSSPIKLTIRPDQVSRIRSSLITHPSRSSHAISTRSQQEARMERFARESLEAEQKAQEIKRKAPALKREASEQDHEGKENLRDVKPRSGDEIKYLKYKNKYINLKKKLGLI